MVITEMVAKWYTSLATTTTVAVTIEQINFLMRTLIRT